MFERDIEYAAAVGSVGGRGALGMRVRVCAGAGVPRASETESESEGCFSCGGCCCCCAPRWLGVCAGAAISSNGLRSSFRFSSRPADADGECDCKCNLPSASAINEIETRRRVKLNSTRRPAEYTVKLKYS